MNQLATSRPSAAQRQTQEHAQELFKLLPTIEILADRVADLYRCRRIDDTADPLFEASQHLRHAWILLVKAQDLCANAEVG